MEINTIELLGKPLFSFLVIEQLIELPAAMPDNEAAFVYILEGRCKNFTELEEFDLKEGEGVLAKSGDGFFKTVEHNGKPNFKAISVRFHKSHLEKVYHGSPTPFYEDNTVSLSANSTSVESNALIKQYIENLETYFNQKELVNDDLLIIKLKELITLLLSFDKGSKVKEIMFNLFEEKTFQFQQIIKSHIFSDVSIQNLAQLTHRSLSTFKRDFRTVYNTTPANYIIDQRIIKAAELLVQTQETISNIAYHCEFKTLAHMSKVFKKKYGTSPTEYRLNFTDKQ